jgi:hypothetical protein
MSIRTGDVVSIRHYSGLSPFKSVVLDIRGDFVTLKLSKDFALMNFLEGDPVVLGYVSSEQVIILGCDIVTIDPKSNTVVVRVDKVDSGANQRQYERYPVSLYADIKNRDSRKKSLATIKDISQYGILIYSKADIDLNTIMDVDIYADKNIIFLRATAIRKISRDSFFEYGMGVIYEDNNTIAAIKDYIKKLRQEQEESIRRIKTM